MTPKRSTRDRIAVLAMAARLSARAGRLDAGSVRRAYRELAAQLHPDKGGERAQFELLIAARDLLLARASQRTVKPDAP